ncbi:uncharacterized protein CIMG_03174 [Coccidioides immitis RS]|uniref:Zn(2)-C6 fungal-type domain-containing protein n=3 Tax=Coccidioides immitis TaxID=5501 RepID=A0A0E1RY24_COCIM|nr:uncharacterized protein CIMG_03174 [Coccidioides immitis RS]EAS32150.1 hypothetical protein CIMG_03174 [Coccidioides immitis RS]KMP07352.1 hypothetical protein CIRG_07033 [Coccidioides immitis RMSCC 2394]KMU72196.1 hypothetical protein CISG_00505 [Coccidioides immitis RMSCC 3703]
MSAALDTSRGAKPATRKPKATRSRNGCWTCRSRKKKCDETHPECMQCLNKGLKCEGYEARLKWGNGVASRGYLKGMNCPIMVMGPGENGNMRKVGGSSKDSPDSEAGRVAAAAAAAEAAGGGGGGRARARARGVKRRTESQTEVEDSSADGSPQSAASLSSSLSSSLGSFDQELFREFKQWGSQCLSMGSDNGYSPFGEVLSYCEESESLMANCLMFQLSLHPEYNERHEAYYAEALRLFRQDVCDHARSLKDATLIAGILLSSIGMQNCKSWTMHLNGLYTILQHRKVAQNQTPIASELISTIGFLDLPSHIVGRQTPTLNIWRDYCRGKTGREPSSGIPYSLLDIFSMVSEPNAEWRFWTWIPEGPGRTTFSDMVWEMTRLAGIIRARGDHRRGGIPIGQRVSANNEVSLPPTDALVERILGQLESLYDHPADVTPAMLNLLLFPAFTVGTQYNLLTPKQKIFLEDFWGEFFLDDGSPHLQLPLKVLREVWATGKTADQIARDWDAEVGLF